MIPLVGTKKELDLQVAVVRKVADAVFAERKKKVAYLVGTMIEIPRAAITAGDIADTAEFFSFGTNDLTQMTFGLSRDDVPRVLKMAVAGGRAKKPKLKLGICGEHGGDPSSVEFCNEIGLDYVSCSPYRLPIARLAAAQAALKTT
jgi:pyruvate,orthophosphate dikinase